MFVMETCFVLFFVWIGIFNIIYMRLDLKWLTANIFAKLIRFSATLSLSELPSHKDESTVVVKALINASLYNLWSPGILLIVNLNTPRIFAVEVINLKMSTRYWRNRVSCGSWPCPKGRADHFLFMNQTYEVAESALQIKKNLANIYL